MDLRRPAPGILDPTRRRLLGWPVALALAGCATPPACDACAIAPFSSAPATDRLPAGWQPYVLRRDLPPTDYHLVDLQGRRVLRAGGTGVSSGLRYALAGAGTDTPWLRWQWRVDDVPQSMCVGDPDADDSPARMIVAFDGDHADLPLRDRAFFDFVELITGQRLPYATLMYVWDATLPVGSVVHYARTSRIRYLVVESGARRTGRWLAYERHLQEDMARAFGEQPRAITSVGVLTDSDDLQVPVCAWYGDIRLERA